MTNPNERIHEAFRQYVRTTALRRDGRSGTIAGPDRLGERKVDDLLAVLDIVIDDYRAGRLTDGSPGYLGRRFWRALNERRSNGLTTGEWNYVNEYPDDDGACRQIGEWLVANRHLADQAPVEAEPTVALTPGDPVWIRSLNTLGEYKRMDGTQASVVYRQRDREYLSALVDPGDLMPMRGVPMVLNPDAGTSTYSLHRALRDDPQEVVFDRWYSDRVGLERDQAVYVNLAGGGHFDFIPAWCLQPAVMPVEARDDGRDIEAGAEEGWVFHRITGEITWAQGFSANGRAFDSYTARRDFADRRGLGAVRSVDYAWLRPGDVLFPRVTASYGLALRRNDWVVDRLDEPGYAYGDAIYVRGNNGGTVRHGYASVSAFSVNVVEALRSVDVSAPGAVESAHGPVVVVDGVEYVRRETVDADMAALTRVLHAAADSNGLCGVYDRSVEQVDQQTTYLKMGESRRSWKALVTETYTVVREVDLAGTYRSEETARASAEVARRMVIADENVVRQERSSITVDRVFPA
jgi:hypothetical protein